MEQSSCIFRQGRSGYCDTALVLQQLGNTQAQAATAYRNFIKNGVSLGHDDPHYQAADQRFLGDEDFIQKTVHQAPQAEIRSWPRSLPFEKLLHAVAEVSRSRTEDFIAAGRQRTLTKPRAQLAYLARGWCGMKAFDIARKLNRDPSMVSRLCADYETARNTKTEKRIAEAIGK